MSVVRIVYFFELVGGPYDGARGLSWGDDGEHDPPARIHVGTCPGDGACGLEDRCVSRARRHTSYWCEEAGEIDGTRPAETVEYRLEDAFLTDSEREPAFGVARYVLAQVDMFGVLAGAERAPDWCDGVK